MRQLPRQRKRQLDPPRSGREVDRVLALHLFELRAQRGHDAHRQRRHKITVALTAPHDDLSPREVDVLHTQPRALEQPKSGA
jgi:hypothetical protein